MRTFKLLLAAVLAAAAPLAAADGALDPTWGGDGVSEGYPSSRPWAAAVDDRQRHLLTGDIGTLDRTEIQTLTNFNDGGGIWEACINGVAFLDNFVMRAAIFDSSNRLLLAGVTTVFGTETTERAFIARFTAADPCAFDTTFSGAGWEYFDDAPYCDTEDCRLIDIEQSGDATTRYVALLEAVQNALLSDYYLVGLTASGNLDPNFGSGGFAPVTAPNLGVLSGGGAELVVDPSNRPLVLHSFYDPAASFDVDAGLTRFQSDGDLDPTFQNAGTYFISDQDTEDTYARTLAVGSDGRFGFGYFNATANHSTVQAVRNDGSGFVGSQLANLDLRAVAFDGLGRLLTATNIVGSDGMEIGRRNVVFSSVVSPDATFGVNGLRFVDIDGGGANGELPVDIVTPGGLPLILVEANQAVSGSQAYLVRLENSLVFADGFEWGSTKFW